jgi:peroxiredoxin
MADTDFSAPSSRGNALSLSDFQGKVPVVLAFVGPLDPQSAEAADFDRHQVEFGRERVQLLVVARAGGPEVRAVPDSGLALPVLADPHDELRAKFGEGQEADFAVVLDRQGDLVERLPLASGAEALLAKVRELGDRLNP